jgi:hypothetical protein
MVKIASACNPDIVNLLPAAARRSDRCRSTAASGDAAVANQRLSSPLVARQSSGFNDERIIV